jgi:two-component system, NtrC family, response regulator HydG
MTAKIHDHPTLLIADDDPAVLRIVSQFGERAGFRVVACTGGREALERLEDEPTDIAVVDLRMPDLGGLDVLRVVRELAPECQIVLMSGEATIDSALEAARIGAIDYLTKPFDFDRLKALLADVRDRAAKRRRLLAVEGEVAQALEFCGMVGRGALMEDLFDSIRRLAPHARTVLVTGETGVGKELVAKAFHHMGPRSRRPFIVTNCSAITETLFESELFGHAKGAFTGAFTSRIGMFEAADGGTLFLDEIGELPLAAQAKLLRALELGEVQRVGTVDVRKVDVRVVAATNRDLSAEIAAGRFRADLFYRLAVVEVRVPALLERREDIPYLTAAFIRNISARLGKHIIGTTPGAERRLASSSWPGNVRQLRNVIERACILAESDLISERELTGSEAWAASARSQSVPTEVTRGGDQSLATLAQERIREVLEQVGGNKSVAARMLGISRRALYRRLDKEELVSSAS